MFLCLKQFGSQFYSIIMIDLVCDIFCENVISLRWDMNIITFLPTWSFIQFSSNVSKK